MKKLEIIIALLVIIIHYDGLLAKISLMRNLVKTVKRVDNWHKSDIFFRNSIKKLP